MLELSRLEELLDYNPETGVFTWKVRRQHINVGQPAGSVTGDGYVRIGIDGKYLHAHRLAWLYVNGVWPTAQIDHKNRIKNDNRINNLRLATNAENQQNRGRNKNNRIGYKNVRWEKERKRWRARFRHNGREIVGRRFKSPEEAYADYCKRIRELTEFCEQGDLK